MGLVGLSVETFSVGDVHVALGGSFRLLEGFDLDLAAVVEGCGLVVPS